MKGQILKMNKEIIQRLYKEVLVEWKMEVADELFSPQFISHDRPEGSPKGSKSFKDFYTDIILSAVPDAHYEVEDLIAEGDKVVVRWRMLGTHKGAYLNLAPTGLDIILKGVAIYRLEKGKIVERWVITDLHGLLEELRSKSKK